MIHIKEILKATKGKLLSGDENVEFKGISIDSRNIGEGYLFIPIIGERFDGHSFIEGAFEAGAAATLTSKEDINIGSDKTFILVEDTLQALQDISKYFLKRANIPVVAVTGSTGKTTTKELISNVLSQKYNVHRNTGNFNNHIGLPLTLLNIKEEHEIAVLEMGMSNRGEIDLLAKLTNPEVGVITNIGICHIENLGSKEEILNAKMEVTNYMNESSVLIINGDDDFLSKLRNENTKYEKVFTGLNDNNDIYGTDIKNLGDEGIEFSIKLEGSTYNFKLEVPGVHNVYNALLAIGVGMHYNVPLEKIKDGLSSFYGSKMRLNIETTDENIKIINDCYNANPDSMRAALSVLENIKTNKRKIAILGDMLELGDFSDSVHKEVGKMVFEKGIDILITVGAGAYNIAMGAIESGFSEGNVYALADNMTAIKLLGCLVEPEDVILVKASRGMKMEEIVQYLLERR